MSSKAAKRRAEYAKREFKRQTKAKLQEMMKREDVNKFDLVKAAWEVFGIRLQ